jgi:hypothetical protein
MGTERKVDLRLDAQRLGLFTVAAGKGKGNVDAGYGGFGGGNDPDSHMKVRLSVKAGTHELLATFLKDTVVSEDVIPKRGRDGNDKDYFEGIGAITVVGPFDVSGPGATESRDKIFVCHPTDPIGEQACAEKILGNLAHRAYRRPVTADDVPRLMALWRQGAKNGGFESGIRLALQKILVSPEFVFRLELDPPDAAPGSVHRVSDVELASRLSFFLWSSMPDDELLAVAEKGGLSDPATRNAQVRRMLSPHAEGPALAGAGEELRRPVAVPAQYPAGAARFGSVPELRRQSAPGAGGRDRTRGRLDVAR